MEVTKSRMSVVEMLGCTMFSNVESRVRLSQNWYGSRQNDPWAIDIYLRHYSSGKNAAPLKALLQSGFVGPGEKIVLISEDADALFVWRKEDFRYDKQEGINNSVFRNEGSVLSSVLISEAVAIA